MDVQYIRYGYYIDFSYKKQRIYSILDRPKMAAPCLVDVISGSIGALSNLDLSDFACGQKHGVAVSRSL